MKPGLAPYYSPMKPYNNGPGSFSAPYQSSSAFGNQPPFSNQSQVPPLAPYGAGYRPRNN